MVGSDDVCSLYAVCLLIPYMLAHRADPLLPPFCYWFCAFGRLLLVPCRRELVLGLFPILVTSMSSPVCRACSLLFNMLHCFLSRATNFSHHGNETLRGKGFFGLFLGFPAVSAAYQLYAALLWFANKEFYRPITPGSVIPCPTLSKG